jgi:hypothetical protein
MAFTVLTEDPAVREVGDLIIVDDRVDRSDGDGGHGDEEEGGDEEEDDEEDAEAEDDDTESER